MWKPRFLTGSDNQTSNGIFTHKLYNHYTPEGGVGWELASTWPRFHSDTHMIHTDPKRFKDWPKYMNDMALLNSHAFQTNHSIFMYGDDFSHP